VPNLGIKNDFPSRDKNVSFAGLTIQLGTKKHSLRARKTPASFAAILLLHVIGFASTVGE